MKLLALDTSSTACSVALRRDGDMVFRHEEQAKAHTRLLMPMIRAVLDEAGATLTELDAIVLGNGPGSFIGLRIGASVAQGLAHGAGIGIVPVSSLAAVASRAMAESNAARVAVAQDAHMNQVYLGLFTRGAGGEALAVAPERLQPLSEIKELGDGNDWVAAGHGWQRYPKLLKANDAFLSGQSSVRFPDARFLTRLAGGEAAIDPQAVEPAYLRSKVAEKPGERHG